MKKLLIALFLCVGFIAYGQRSALVEATAGTDTCYGTVAKNIVLPTKLSQEYDYSYQIIPTQVSGDSVNTAVALWQANTHAGTAWTEITSARDTITATSGILVEGTDAKGMRHRITLTGISSDTSKFIIYQVLKLDREFK